MGINIVIEGVEWIANVMNKVAFFNENPQYRYAVLEHAVKIFFSLIANETAKISPSEMYQSIKEEFGKSFGEYENVAPVLCTMTKNYQKKIEENKSQIAEFKNPLK